MNAKNVRAKVGEELERDRAAAGSAVERAARAAARIQAKVDRAEDDALNRYDLGVERIAGDIETPGSGFDDSAEPR